MSSVCSGAKRALAAIARGHRRRIVEVGLLQVQVVAEPQHQVGLLRGDRVEDPEAAAVVLPPASCGSGSARKKHEPIAIVSSRRPRLAASTAARAACPRGGRRRPSTRYAARRARLQPGQARDDDVVRWRRSPSSSTSSLRGLAVGAPGDDDRSPRASAWIHSVALVSSAKPCMTTRPAAAGSAAAQARRARSASGAARGSAARAAAAGYGGERDGDGATASTGRQLCRRGRADYNSTHGRCPTANFTHHFLIAMPAMADPHFAHTLTYVCEHNEDGALGIVVNKPIDMTLSALFEQIDVPLADDALRAHARAFRRPGPGRPRLRAAPAARQLAVDARRSSDDLGLTTSKDVLEAVGARRGPDGRARVAGLRRLVGRASSSRRSRRTPGSPSRPTPDVLFDTPAEARLPAAMRLLGIDFSRLSDDVGHA